MYSERQQQQQQQYTTTTTTTNNQLRLERQCLTWSRILPTGGCVPPPPRSGAASVVVKGRLYVFGGYGGGTGRLDDFYSYDFKTGIWEEVEILSDEKPGCRENNGVVISDSSTPTQDIYLFGGYNGTSWLNDLWKFDIESKRWTCIQESSDGPMDGGSGAGAGAGAGGVAARNNNNVVNNNNNNPAALEQYNYNNNNNNNNSTNRMQQGGALGNNNNNNNNNNVALQVRGKVPSRRFGYVSVVHDNKLVLFGGFDGSRWLNDMYVFDFSSKVWSEIQAKGTLPSVRSCPAWAKDDTHVYIQGGYDGVERKSDFFACNLTTYTWIQMPCHGTPPNPARYFHTCCLYGQKMYVFGGYSGDCRLSDMYAYDFETNHWSQVDCTLGQQPSGRSSLVAQVYENCLYIFGGYNGRTVLNDFYKFRLKPIGLPPPALVHDFCKLLNNPDFADIVFVVEGREIYAHIAVLAVRSEYFRVMLSSGSGGWRESKQYYHSIATAAVSTTPSSSSSTTPSSNNNSKGQLYDNDNNTTTTSTEQSQKQQSSPASPMGHSPQQQQQQQMNDDNTTTNNNMNYQPMQQQQEQFQNNDSTSTIAAAAASISPIAARNNNNNIHTTNFNNNMRGPIVLEDISYVVFLKVLEYLYTDTLQLSSSSYLEIGIHLLIASERFMLDRLKALCEDIIRRDIHHENAISIFIASHRHNATGLKDIVLEYILCNLNHPIIQAGLVELKAEPDLLLEIIRRNTSAMIQAGVVGGGRESGGYDNNSTGFIPGHHHQQDDASAGGGAVVVDGNVAGGGEGVGVGGGGGGHHHQQQHHHQHNHPQQLQQRQQPQQQQQQQQHQQQFYHGQFGAGAGYDARRL